MDFDKLIGNCQALEKTVSILVKSNSNKQTELTRLQNCIFRESQVTLNEIIGKERQLQDKLDALRYKKSDLDTEVKQYSDINEKLSDLVSIAQKEDSSDDDDDNCKNDNMSHAIIEALNDYEEFKTEYHKFSGKVEQMAECAEKESQENEGLIKTNQELVVDLHRNDGILRLYAQQNKYAEYQFDLILNQIPWEPLTTQYIDQLKASSDHAIRNIAESLQIQKNEIEELTEALNSKKTKKLEVLKNLYAELNVFVQKRDEAALMTRFNDC